MMEYFGQFVFWHWWIIGLLLLGIELLAPGEFFMWMGISAVVTGGVVLVGPEMGWQFQVVIFGILSVASITGWRLYQKHNPPQSDEPLLNRRGSQYIGRTFELADDMRMGRGKIRVDDTSWRVELDEGGDLPAGSRVKVVDISNTVLKVKPA